MKAWRRTGRGRAVVGPLVCSYVVTGLVASESTPNEVTAGWLDPIGGPPATWELSLITSPGGIVVTSEQQAGGPEQWITPAVAGVYVVRIYATSDGVECAQFSEPFEVFG